MTEIRDAAGNELKVGDEVVLRGRIKDLDPPSMRDLLVETQQPASKKLVTHWLESESVLKSPSSPAPSNSRRCGECDDKSSVPSAFSSVEQASAWMVCRSERIEEECINALRSKAEADAQRKYTLALEALVRSLTQTIVERSAKAEADSETEQPSPQPEPVRAAPELRTTAEERTAWRAAAQRTSNYLWEDRLLKALSDLDTLLAAFPAQRVVFEREPTELHDVSKSECRRWEIVRTQDGFWWRGRGDSGYPVRPNGNTDTFPDAVAMCNAAAALKGGA